MIDQFLTTTTIYDCIYVM